MPWGRAIKEERYLNRCWPTDMHLQVKRERKKINLLNLEELRRTFPWTSMLLLWKNNFHRASLQGNLFFFLHKVLFNLSGNILISGQRIQRKPLFSVTVAAWLKLDTNRGQQSIFSTCNPDNPWNSHVQYSLTITDGRVKWFHKNEKSQVTFYGLLGIK